MCVFVCKKERKMRNLETFQILDKFISVCAKCPGRKLWAWCFLGLYCTICGISLQALAFFLARASHGGSSWVRGAGTVWLMLLFSFSTSTGLEISKEHDTDNKNHVNIYTQYSMLRMTVYHLFQRTKNIRSNVNQIKCTLD